MVEPECRRKYAYTNHTREVILRVSCHFCII